MVSGWIAVGLLGGHALGQDEDLFIDFLPDSQAQVWWPAEANGRALSTSGDLSDWTPLNERPFLSVERYWHQFPAGDERLFFQLEESAPYEFGVPSSPGQYELALQDQEWLRTYRLILPASYSNAQPAPLALIFHGSGQSARSFSTNHPALLTKANAEGVILVIPDGTPNPVNGKLSWSTNPLVNRGIDDVSFSLHLLEHLDAVLNIDRGRVFAGGFSNGGVMAHKLASETDGVIAAIASVASSLGYSEDNVTVVLPDPPLGPVSALIINGRLDMTRPWDGGINSNGTLMASVDDSVQHWISGNGCGGAPVVTSLAGGTVTRSVYSGCDAGTVVELVDLSLMDHIWPDLADGVNYDANVRVIDFFLAQPALAPAAPANTPVPAAPGRYHLTFLDQGHARTLRLQIPAGYSGATPTPLIFVFHGGGQSAATFSNLHPALYQKCQSEGMLLVVPDATVHPDTGTRLWGNKPFAAVVDDRDFVESLLAHLDATLNVDLSRVYAAGFSNGGSFCHYLSGTRSGMLAAIAPVGCALGWNDPVTLAPIAPPAALEAVPALLINGLLDAKRPFWGGVNVDGVPIFPASQAVAYWTSANGCAAGSTSSTNGPGTVSTTVYGPCPNGKEVILVAVSAMDHIWPDANDGVDYDANVEVVDFFKRHQR